MFVQLFYVAVHTAAEIDTIAVVCILQPNWCVWFRDFVNTAFAYV